MSSISSEDTSRNEDSTKIKNKSNLHKTTLLNSGSKSINSSSEEEKNIKNIKKIKNEGVKEGKLLSKPIINNDESKKQKYKSGCAHCGKKLKLVETSIGKCRCEHIFCSKHRFPESHECSYDWKEMSRKKLEKQHQRVVADKLTRI